MGNMVITVSRQYGSGGKTIAAMLAQKLGINCYSREILKMASEDSGINERLFGMSDEKIRHAGWFKTLSRPYTGELLPPEDKGFVSDDNLFNYQAKTIKELAEKESCIIVGRCANYILRDNPDVLSVFVHADDDFCLARAMSVTVSAKKKLKNLLNALTNTVRTFITITRDITGRMRDIMTSVLTVQNSVLRNVSRR